MVTGSSVGGGFDAIRYVFSGNALSDAQRIGVAARAGARQSAEKTAAANELDNREQRAVDELRQTDRRVRQHEQMHIAAGGELILGGPNYAFETGPDGKRYAVSGEVSIDTSPARTPEETVPKAQHIRRTALAPADPSPQDRSVAAVASRMEAEAQLELAQKRREESAAGSTSFYQRVAQYGAAPPEGQGASVNAFA